MMRALNVTTGLKLAAIGLTALLVACGGGGDSSTPAGTDTTTITGSVVAAPVNGASLLVKDSSGNTVAGPVTTGSDGTYSINIPDSALSGELSFESSGGTFDDEATGMLGNAAGTLAAYLAGSSLSAGSSVHLTPASTIVQNLVTNHGKSLSEAKAAFQAAFGFDADTSVAPADATNPAAGAAPAELLAGLRAAAFSQLNMELLLNVVDQFELLSALATDIADGTFDGKNGGSDITIGSAVTLPANIRFRFFWAMLNFHGGSKNQTNVAKSELGEMPFIAGYVAGAADGVNVVIREASAGSTEIIASATTGSDGMYAIDTTGISLPSGVPLIFEASDGSTFARTAWLAAGSVSVSAGSSVNLTPASTIHQKLVALAAADAATADTQFTEAFNFDSDTSIAPANINDPMAGAEKDELLAGLRAAAFAQLTADLGLVVADQSALLSGLADDIAEIGFDGVGAGGDVTVTGSSTTVTLPIDIQNRYTQALVNTHKATMAETGLTDDQIGILPFAKVALTGGYNDSGIYETGSYIVTYVPNPMMMKEMEGKTTFKLLITGLDGTTPLAAGTNVSLMPMMFMATMMHASPVDGCTESTTEGEYDCTVYYLMASKMMGDMSMGYWQLGVMIGDMMGVEPAVFYPTIEMAMGDTAKTKLLGQADMIEGMMMGMAAQRGYYLFRDGLTLTLDDEVQSLKVYSFDLFIAAMEDMKSFPAVYEGQILNNGSTDFQLTVDTMSVRVSSDAGFTWIDAIDANNDGHWSAPGITGLTSGVDGEGTPLLIELRVNGFKLDNSPLNEQKTTDGLPASGENDYATFTVMSGGM